MSDIDGWQAEIAALAPVVGDVEWEGFGSFVMGPRRPRHSGIMSACGTWVLGRGRLCYTDPMGDVHTSAALTKGAPLGLVAHSLLAAAAAYEQAMSDGEASPEAAIGGEDV